MSFWSELRRRNTFKVCGAYAVLAWLLMQIADTTFATLGLPDWTVTFVTVVLLLGLPVAGFLAWAYELTPDGIKRTEDVPVGAASQASSGQKLNNIVVALLGIAVVYLVVDNYVLNREGESPSRLTSLAVLPFSNLSPDPNDAYFAAGLHEEILNRLASLSGLRVVSRSSVLRYTDQQRPSMRQIGEELGVQAVIDGSVRYAGNQIRVSATLIDVAEDTPIWTETYPGDLSNVENIFRIQADIAMNVANTLETVLSPADRAAIESIPTQSREAYALYLRALPRAGEGAPTNSNRETIDLLDRAVSIDPDFAPARALSAFGRSDLFVNTNQSTAATESELLELVERIRSDAERALAKDPSLGWANVAIAQTHMWNWRWSEARRAFDRALAANTRHSSGLESVYSRYALLSAWLGDTDRSIEFASRAVELTPNQPGPFFQRGVAHAYAGDAASSVEALRRAVAIAPDFALAHSWLGFVLRATGDAGGALTELRLTEQILGEAMPVVFLPELAYAYHLLNQTDDPRRLVNEIERRGPETVGIGGQAMASLAIGDEQEARRLLAVAIEKARREEADAGFLQLMVIKKNVPQDPLLDEPEFVRLRDELRGH